ncbi:TIGR01777 family oxidoreductase [Pseudohongiella sp. SYSU M77423]|uniref:TIGR01777 family oxidoreductase n=1 Tax=Pseudohongiella sp. SYSU M77423 TaxID=3042312 RepID=UPI002480B6C7|nr:TIGR01777 family oxidoreductase [Pseudohongiella sp. SYSU M77423]MDH7944801.1 TIGR01777 family oxidoreductase [Pseudohongiella sp. SYSU M77423]
MRILMKGGTGFIGQVLVRELLAAGHSLTILVRDYAAARVKLGAGPELVRNLDELGQDEHFDAVINLAGEGIAAKRWTAARKKVLMNSRLDTTREVIQLLQRLDHKPECLINASAVGYYGTERDRPLTERDSGGSGFSHELCKRWEDEARKAESLGVRVCLMRFGVVLGAGGGMLARLLPFYRFWLGGRLGHGEQMLSWIHRTDLINALQWVLQDHEQTGVFNVTAPHPVSNRKFNDTLSDLLRRPAVFHQPPAMVLLMFGEMGDQLLLKGQQVLPARLEHAGFTFQYPEIHGALQACLCDLGLN